MPPQNAYLENTILSADPLELVRLLYRAAGDAVRNAAGHLAAGRIAERSRQINRAHAVLSELLATLDHSRGGVLSQRLAGLYDYMQRRLLEANMLQRPEPLAEVEALLSTLLQGWERIPTSSPDAFSSPSARPLPESGRYGSFFVPESAPAYPSHDWSF